VEGNEEGAVLLVNSAGGCVESTRRRQEPNTAGPLFEIILELGTDSQYAFTLHYGARF
jgi:hypothetical protein